MYSWSITGVKVKDIGDKKDVICSISFKKTGSDRFGRTGVYVGTIPVDTSNIDSDNFSGFTSLVQDDIIKWLEQMITPEYDKHINEHIDDQISMNTVVEKTIPLVLETPEEVVEEFVEEVVVVKKTKSKAK